MKGAYDEEEIYEQDVLAALEGAGLRYKNGNRYILAQCATHEDSNPSVQIFKNDWFVQCHSGCGRYHITKAFPELRSQSNTVGSGVRTAMVARKRSGEQKMTEHTYKQFDLMEEWKAMPLIPRNHKFKGLPLELLDELGWRWDNGSYFIPYFSSSKTKIPFAQWRHLSGERRFTFLKDAEPVTYGSWNILSNKKIFICEGTSDFAVLSYCAVPCVAMPSAASGKLVGKLATYCLEHGIQVVYAGDNDTAGDKLREALEAVMPYRVCQPPEEYKDWGDFFVAKGVDEVIEWTSKELLPHELTEAQKVIQFMGGGTEIKIAH